jgi:hypothetical protein
MTSMSHIFKKLNKKPKYVKKVCQNGTLFSDKGDFFPIGIMMEYIYINI